MNEYTCQSCRARSYSSASYEYLRHKTFEKCGGAITQSEPQPRPAKNPKVIAVDFDGCLVTNRFPEVGEPIPATIAALKREQENGTKVILWTCRRDEQLEAAVRFCAQHDIRIDAVNRNLPEIVEAFGGDTIKVFANEYWDDRARAMPPPPPTAADLIKDERDTLMKRHHEQVEVIRKRIDNGGLSDAEKRLLKDLRFETNYDRRTEAT